MTARLQTSSLESGHTLYLEAVDGAWWYALPERCGGWFAGYCTGTEEVKHRAMPLQSLFEQAFGRTRLLAGALPGATLTAPVVGRAGGAYTFDTVAGPGWIAVGDAAFAPHPLSGMGIEFGVASAIQAARIVLAEARARDLDECQQSVRTVADQQERMHDSYLW